MGPLFAAEKQLHPAFAQLEGLSSEVAASLGNEQANARRRGQDITPARTVGTSSAACLIWFSFAVICFNCCHYLMQSCRAVFRMKFVFSHGSLLAV
jgi:hypothetical protein